MIKVVTGSIRKVLNAFGYDIIKTKDLSRELSIGSWIKKLSIETIIDVGSNEGQFIKTINEVLPNKKIIAFEPIKEVYEKLLSNIKGINVTAYNMGLSNKNGTAEINISKNSVSSSILNMEAIHKSIYPSSEYVTKEIIELKRLDDVIDTKNLKNNILLKIDVQGYEHAVIAGGTNVIKAARAVIIEFSFVPLYEGQWLFDDTYRYFTNNGFKFIGMADQVISEKIGVPLYGDLIFVKKSIVESLY